MESFETDVTVGSPADREARFHSLFSKNYDDVLRYCLRRLPITDANDAASDVFVVAWRRIDAAPAGGDARLWLYGIARNVVRNSRRSARRSIRLRSKVAGLAPETVDGPERQVVQGDELRHVLAALDRLSPKDQEVLRLRAMERLEIEQIAEVPRLQCRSRPEAIRASRQTTPEQGRQSRADDTKPPVRTGRRGDRMNSDTLIRQLAEADEYAPEHDLPETARPSTVALTEIRRRIDDMDVKELTKPVEPERRRRSGWLVAAAAFATIVLVAGLVAVLGSRSATEPPASEVPTTEAATPTTEAAPPITEAAPPTTEAAESQQPVISAEEAALLDDYVEAVNSADPEAIDALLAPGFTMTSSEPNRGGFEAPGDWPRGERADWVRSSHARRHE